MENAIKEFNAKVQAVTGKAARESDITRFIDQAETAIAHGQAETAIAHGQARLVQIGFADFRTLSGRAVLVEVAF